MRRRGILYNPRARRLSKGVQTLAVASDSQPVGLRIGDSIARELAYERVATIKPEDAWRIYAPPRTLGATEADQLAMDSHLQGCGFHSLLSHAINLGMGLEEIAPQFLGYPYLAGLSQNGLIRAGVTTVAEEMTKRWVEVKRVGKSAKGTQNDEKVKALTSALKDFGLQELFNEAAQKCDFDGGCLIYTDTGNRDDDNAQKEELYLDGSILRGRVKRFTLVEAINLYPGLYNATDPLAPDYFNPDSWLVLGRRIHNSRFLYFAPNKVNMLLRPAYNFFGIPAAQLALDYVAHFTKTREAAQRLLTKFSLTVFKSDMSQILSGGSSGNMDLRLQYLAQKRDNDAILLIDKEREDVIKLETPLAGTTDIVRQSLEFVAAIFRTTVVKLLGISPAGMNATGEYDDKNFLEHVGSKQEKILARPLEQVNKLLQLHLFGEIDPTIVMEFVPLSDEDDSQKATTKKTEADRDAVYLDRGVLDQQEVRQRLSDDPASDYGFINPEEVPEAPEGEEDMNGSAPGGMVGLQDEDQAREVTADNAEVTTILQKLKKLLGMGMNGVAMDAE